ncbi:MAG: hypothetical protein ACQEP5_00495 [Actinomycetota bacterium]
MEYIIEDRIFILNEKEYKPRLEDDIYCLESIDCQDTFNWILILDKMRDAFAYFKYQVDAKNKPKDYILLDANHKYEKITRYEKKEVVGKKITEIECDKKNCAHELINKFYRTAVKGTEQNFLLSSKLTGRNYTAFVYSPSKNFFVIIFKEVPEKNERKNYLNGYRIVIDYLNRVCRSRAVITETNSPSKYGNTRNLKMVSSEIAEYLGIIDKNIRLEENTVITGLDRISIPPDKKSTVEKLESGKVNILSKFQSPSEKAKKDEIYFMINR